MKLQVFGETCPTCGGKVLSDTLTGATECVKGHKIDANTPVAASPAAQAFPEPQIEAQSVLEAIAEPPASLEAPSRILAPSEPPAAQPVAQAAPEAAKPEPAAVATILKESRPLPKARPTADGGMIFTIKILDQYVSPLLAEAENQGEDPTAYLQRMINYACESRWLY